jgi:hypothetical protein
MRKKQHQSPPDNLLRLQKRRSVALGLTLFVTAVIVYAISFIKTRELEEQRHQKDPQAHALRPSRPSTSP